MQHNETYVIHKHRSYPGCSCRSISVVHDCRGIPVMHDCRGIPVMYDCRGIPVIQDFRGISGICGSGNGQNRRKMEA